MSSSKNAQKKPIARHSTVFSTSDDFKNGIKNNLSKLCFYCIVLS